MSKLHASLLAIAATAMLAACGGDSSSGGGSALPDGSAAGRVIRIDPGPGATTKDGAGP